MPRKPSGQVVTFYSFKGGVGRSFALANIGVLLARWGHKVLCVDWDLEAPGLNHYFHQWAGKSRTKGLVPLVNGFVSGRHRHWRNHVVHVNIAGTGNRLDILPAGQRATNYIERMQQINWSVLYRRKGFGSHLETIRQEWKRLYDFTLIDSRTGISDIAGICTVQMPDVLVFLLTANRQSIDGACDIARRSVDSRVQLPFERNRLLTLPIVSRYEQRVEFKIASKWDKVFHSQLRPFYRGWLPARTDISKIIAGTRLPHVPYWSFGEQLPVVVDRKRNDDPESVNYPLANIAALLAHGLDNANQLITAREAYIATSKRASRRLPLPDKTQGLLFLSHSLIAGRFANRLASVLTRHGFATQSTASFRSSKDRDSLLDVLRDARSFILIVDEKFSSFQIDELETYVSLSIRDSGPNRIIPVVRSRAALHRVPAIWRDLATVEASTRRSIKAVARDLLEALSSDGIRHLNRPGFIAGSIP